MAEKTFQIDNGSEVITFRYASFGERLAARLLDVLIIVIPNSIIPIIPAWLYWAFQQSSLQQATVGQRALGIKVIDLQGRQIDFGRATGRFFGNYVNILTLFIGYFMFFFNDRRQCLHDYMAGCLVVREISREQDIIGHLVD